MTVIADPPVLTKQEYDHQGWYQSSFRLGPDFLERLRSGVERLGRSTGPEILHEQDGRTVRAMYGCHRLDPAFADLVRLAPLVDLAETLVGGPVYVYQSKVNLKQAHEGGSFPWHQDYSIWHSEDGMPRPAVVNLAILLDEVDERNGPLILLTGTHQGANITAHVPGVVVEVAPQGPRTSTGMFSANQEEAERLAREHEHKLVTGARGTIYAFSPCILHSSSSNRSDRRRAMALVTYNSVDNVPTRVRRSTFHVERDTTPVVRLP